MIIGKTHSADGGYRRIPIRRTHIVGEQERQIIMSYLEDKLLEVCTGDSYLGLMDLFPNIIENIKGTPLEILEKICIDKFGSAPKSLKVNLSKYAGMLLRETVYESRTDFFEQMVGSVRKYRIATEKEKAKYFDNNRHKVLNNYYGG